MLTLGTDSSVIGNFWNLDCHCGNKARNIISYACPL